MPKRSPVRATAWILVAVAVPWALFVASLSSDFYNLTTPPEFSLHVLARKVYSIGAFALVGYLIARALIECGVTLSAKTVISLGVVYSGSIEIAQYNGGSQEGFWWNLFDVGCGALGGAIAACIPGGSTKSTSKASRSADRSKRTRNVDRYRIVQFRNHATRVALCEATAALRAEECRSLDQCNVDPRRIEDLGDFAADVHPQH